MLHPGHELLNRPAELRTDHALLGGLVDADGVIGGDGEPIRVADQHGRPLDV